MVAKTDWRTRAGESELGKGFKSANTSMANFAVSRSIGGGDHMGKWRQQQEPQPAVRYSDGKAGLAGCRLGLTCGPLPLPFLLPPAKSPPGRPLPPPPQLLGGSNTPPLPAGSPFETVSGMLGGLGNMFGSSLPPTPHDPQNISEVLVRCGALTLLPVEGGSGAWPLQGMGEIDQTAARCPPARFTAPVPAAALQGGGGGGGGGGGAGPSRLANASGRAERDFLEEDEDIDAAAGVKPAPAGGEDEEDGAGQGQGNGGLPDQEATPLPDLEQAAEDQGGLTASTLLAVADSAQA